MLRFISFISVTKTVTLRIISCFFCSHRLSVCVISSSLHYRWLDTFLSLRVVLDGATSLNGLHLLRDAVAGICCIFRYVFFDFLKQVRINGIEEGVLEGDGEFVNQRVCVTASVYSISVIMFHYLFMACLKCFKSKIAANNFSRNGLMLFCETVFFTSY